MIFQQPTSLTTWLFSAILEPGAWIIRRTETIQLLDVVSTRRTMRFDLSIPDPLPSPVPLPLLWVRKESGVLPTYREFPDDGGNGARINVSADDSKANFSDVMVADSSGNRMSILRRSQVDSIITMAVTTAIVNTHALANPTERPIDENTRLTIEILVAGVVSAASHISWERLQHLLQGNDVSPAGRIIFEAATEPMCSHCWRTPLLER